MDDVKLKSFRYWKTQEIEDTFGISEVKNSQVLAKWLNTKCEITAAEKRRLEQLRVRLEERVTYWNEATLSFYFISPLIDLVDFNSDRYAGFLESKLELIYGDQVIQGNVDFLVATGKQIPKAPFFALHEYKPEVGVVTDPQGQLLIAMLAADTKNRERGLDLPLYGTYIIGRLFFFVYFYKNQYARSRAYDATQEDIRDVFFILKEVKRYVEEVAN